MRHFSLAVTLLGLAAAAAWGAAESTPQKANDPPKKKLRTGYSTEAAPVTTTEASPAATVEDTVRTLQGLQGNPLLTPQMREQVNGIINQAEDMGEKVGAAEYGRPSGATGATVGLNKRASHPSSLRGPAGAAVNEVGRAAPMVDLSGGGDPDSRRSGAAAAGVPLSLGMPQTRSAATALFDPPAAQKQQFDRSALRARQVLKSNPEDHSALEVLAGTELAAGNFEDSIGLADRALAANPSSADAFMLRAMAREAMGDMRGAVQDARQAARIDPSRHGSRAAAAEAGARLFDPASAESWGLLEKMSTPPPQEGRFPWALTLAFFAAVASGAAAYGVKVIWADLPPESRQKLVGFFSGSTSKQTARRPSGTTNTPMPQRGGSALRPGARLGAKYELIRALGRDGTVEVWKAHDTLLARDVLLKRLYVGRDSGELDLRRQEAKQAATLHHPNIAELFEIAELPEGLFAVYEYASGKSLASILEEKTSLSLRQARDVLVPVCRALEHAHRRGVVHGGLSPDRIVLTRQGYVKVMDFVLARTMTAGTSDYSAPEIKRGAPTAASDVYSAGIILHQMLAGALPGENGWEPAGKVAALLDKSLDLDVRTRLASAREMLEELRTIPADTLPPRKLTPLPTTTDSDEKLTSEPDEESRLAAGGAVGPEDPDGPLIDPGPPTFPTNPG